MSPISSLIGKLNEQFQQNAPADQLLQTVRSIEASLLKDVPPPVKTLGTTKVAVILPASAPREEMPAQVQNLTEPIPSLHLATDSPKPVQPTVELVQAPAQSTNGRLFDPLTDIPTLAQHQTGKEINETISATPFSVNDKLKNQVQEVGHILKDSPIRDLKKAIGINDRFVFINELFRGDDTMYERSIKTINGFRILAEAQYWMERELKVKLGWNEESPVVSHFYQLVRRRFSGI